MPASVNSTSCLLDSELPDFVTKRLAGMAPSYTLGQIKQQHFRILRGTQRNHRLIT